MKRTIALIALFVISSFYTNAQSQSLSLGIEGGINISNITSTPAVTTNSRTGLIVGSVLDINVTPTITIAPGLRYVMKGWTSTPTAGVTFTDKLNYLEVPVLLKVKFPLTEVKPYLAAGPVLGIQLSATEEQTNGTQNTSQDISSLVESIDFGLLFGGGLDFRVGFKTDLFVQFGYELGLSNILKNATTQTIKNNGIQITGGVKFKL
ncbi:MAG: porin family protein [Ignavibacteria bacterium]